MDKVNDTQQHLATYYSSREIGQPYNDYWAARRSLAEKIKRLSLQLQTSELSVEELQAIESVVDQQVEQLVDKPQLNGRDEWSSSGQYGSWQVHLLESTPVLGRASPLSPELSIWFEQTGEETRAFASVKFNWLYEGPTGICHGGWVAAVFDELLGTAQVLSGKTGMTASLNTRYHKPTPLNKELLLSAWVTEVEDKKIVIRGEMHDGETLTASCEGIFVIPSNSSNIAFGDIE